MMTLFTIIIDYKGGTYLSQVEAREVDQALALWGDRLDHGALGGLAPADLESLAHDLKKERATSIQGLVGVWCATLLLDDQLVLINVVRTCPG